MVLGGLAADIRVGTRAESVRQFTADVELRFGIRHEQCLGVSVHSDEFNAFKANLDHAVDGVDTAAAHADDLNHCKMVLRCGHSVLPYQSIPSPSS